MVFDGAYSSELTPVPLNRDIVWHVVAWLGCAALLVSFKVVIGLCFIGSHRRVLVDASSESLLGLFVMAYDQNYVVTEDFKSLLLILSQIN